MFHNNIVKISEKKKIEEIATITNDTKRKNKPLQTVHKAQDQTKAKQKAPPLLQEGDHNARWKMDMNLHYSDAQPRALYESKTQYLLLIYCFCFSQNTRFFYILII